MSDRTYILVVDDNNSRRNWILHVLGTFPCSLEAVSSAHQALQSMRKVRPDAVVIGEDLRGTSLQRFQAVMRRRYPDIPVVVTACAWPIGKDVMTMSPGAYHCLLLCAQAEENKLRARVRKALREQSDSGRTSAEFDEKKYACV